MKKEVRLILSIERRGDGKKFPHFNLYQLKTQNGELVAETDGYEDFFNPRLLLE